MAETTIKRHPIRAAIWGFILGLGVVVYLTLVFPVIALESINSVATQAVMVIVIVMIVSIVWGLYGPAKKPKGSPPISSKPEPPAAAVPAAADDSEDPAENA